MNSLEYRQYLRNIKRNNDKYNCGDCFKYSQKEVEDMFAKDGYKVISGYKGVNCRVTYICPKHGKKSVLMSNFLSGSRCRDCFNEVRLVPYDEVKKAFEDRDYELISTEYKGNKRYLKYRCSKHPDKIQKIKYNDIQQGHGCAFCKADEASERFKGEGARCWRGGVSSLSSYLRTAISCWKYESMRACNFKCVLTNGKFDAIHHLTSFTSIMDEMLDELNIDIRESVSMYSDEELEIMSNRIVAKHNEYGLGVCICDRLHKLFHKLYCKVGCTPEMFNEFTERYKRGEFNEQ